MSTAEPTNEAQNLSSMADDVLRAVLARAVFDDQAALKRVCKRFLAVITSRAFREERRASGCLEHRARAQYYWLCGRARAFLTRWELSHSLVDGGQRWLLDHAGRHEDESIHDSDLCLRRRGRLRAEIVRGPTVRRARRHGMGPRDARIGSPGHE